MIIYCMFIKLAKLIIWQLPFFSPNLKRIFKNWFWTNLLMLKVIFISVIKRLWFFFFFKSSKITSKTFFLYKYRGTISLTSSEKEEWTKYFILDFCPNSIIEGIIEGRKIRTTNLVITNTHMKLILIYILNYYSLSIGCNFRQLKSRLGIAISLEIGHIMGWAFYEHTFKPNYHWAFRIKPILAFWRPGRESSFLQILIEEKFFNVHGWFTIFKVEIVIYHFKPNMMN